MSENNLLDNLNSAQRSAVTHKDGPLLVVAGAGAGKTRVITQRIAHLIGQGVAPARILAVTFTNKAASEMRERIAQLLKPDTYDLPTSTSMPFVGTFHSLGVHILRESGRAIGVDRWFTIYDRDDCLALIRKCEKGLGIDPKHFAPNAILSHISKAKGNLVSRADYEEAEGATYFGETVSKVWREYEKELSNVKSLDFDDLLVETVRLLTEHEPVRKHYQTKWQYLHIDEYQDTNKVQYEMIRLLSAAHQNVCVVGDADQTIYTWRGASIENIMGFERDFPGATVVVLEENYRSTSNILNAANEVIRKNKNRKEKTLFTQAGEGEKIVLFEAFDAADEADFVVRTVSENCKLKSENYKLEEFAVLYRANFQSRVLEEAFLRAGLPYTVLGTRFFERAEVKDVLAYVRAAMNPADRTSFERAVSSPRRGIGDKTLNDHFSGAETQEKLRNFLKLLADFRERLLNTPLPESLRYIVRNSGLEADLKKKGDEGTERLENIQELVNLSLKYKDLNNEEAVGKLIEEASLASDQDSLMHKSSKTGVKLMTVHAAKGLEFRIVFIVGLEQGLFPHEPNDPSDGTIEHAEEERRLFYVALTRARERVYLSHSTVRNIYGEQRVNLPSEFISDIPSELFEPNSRSDLKTPKGPTSESGRNYLPDITDKYDAPDWL
ncbi:MAG TPA: UvrD-helicase domain-containing protein [Candidatus Paceibacterota bacterium]